jgi:agmatinase
MTEEVEKFEQFIGAHMGCDPALYMKSYAGLSSFFRARYTQELESVDVALVGVPIDLGLTQRSGARHGPREIRAQSANVFYYNPLTKFSPFELVRVADVGDVPLRSAFNLAEVIEEIYVYFQGLVAAGVAPVVAGGDHSISYPIMKALKSQTPLGLIHIDSHLDCSGMISNSTLHHGTPFSNAGMEGIIDPKRSVHVAIRDPYMEMETYCHESGMTVINIDQFYDLGVSGVIEEVRRVVGTGPTYISIDIDALDPAYAPGTGTPVVGGITSYEAKRLLHGLRGLDIVGADLVEVSPPFDSAGITALAGAQLMFELLCLVAENVKARPLRAVAG